MNKTKFRLSDGKAMLASALQNVRNFDRRSKRFLMTLAALFAMTAGAWAQTEQTVDVTPVTGQTNQWTLAMPAGNVVLHEEYEPELTATFKAANALTIEAGKATVSVTENGQPVTTATLADGKLSPLYQGQTVILKASEGYKFRKVEAKEEAAAVKVTAITLNKTATTITAGQTETLSVSQLTPDDATDQTVTWSSDNEAVATVDADGKVTAVALGTANITATANDGSGVTATCAVTVSKVVTINQSDWGWSNSFTKDGVTVSAGMIDPQNGNIMDGGSFSTTLGNFTKIVVTTASCYASGTGWSGGGSSMTWAGTPASTVSFSGEFMGRGMTQTTIVCTIEPAN